MPIPVVCGSCGTKLVAPDAAAGKKVKCRNCQAIIPVPEAVAEEFEFVEDAPVVAAQPVTPAKPKPKPVVVVDEDEGEFEFDAAPKKKAKAAVAVDDEAPAPKKKSKPKLVRDDDDDEDEDDAPKSKNKKGKKPAKKKTNPLMLVGIGAVALIAVGFLGTMIWYFTIREDKPSTAATAPQTPFSIEGKARPGAPVSKEIPAGWSEYDLLPSFSIYFKDTLGIPQTKFSKRSEFDVIALTVSDSPEATNGMQMTTTQFTPEFFAIAKANTDEFLDGEKERLGRARQILSDKKFTVDGHPGREFKVKEKTGVEGIMRFVLAHNRLYIYRINEPGISESSENYRIFFENVTLKP